MRIAITLSIALFAIAPAKSVIQIFDSPTGDIAGLGWEDGTLWALDAFTKEVFNIDPGSGNVLDSFTSTIIPAGYEATGLAVENGVVYVGAWNNSTNGYIFKYDYSGTYLGGVNMCGG
ncbi:MAG: hypothetical protein KAT09_08760 [Candidatus Aegiribacteria sp.]|nr:hypothetical protein [Candidatus Aegiribacteria sp.]